MNITNKLSLPPALVRAVENDGYSRGRSDLTVTELISPPRLVALRRAHEAELSEDVSDRIWSLFGQVMHGILERSAEANALTEERLFTTILGWRVSGQLDHYVLDEDGTLSDYKVSSTWSAKDGGKDEWSQQINSLALLLREHGFRVKAGRIVLLCRDWRKNEALRYGSSGYPERQVAILPVPIWPDRDQIEYMTDRVRLHQAARATYAKGTGLPLCSPSERWQRAAVWAVVKDGNKKATKLCASEDEAKAVIGDAPKMHIEFRPGLAVRCTQYCVVRPFCERLADGQFQPGDLGADEEVTTAA